MEFDSLDKSKLTPAMQQYATFRDKFPFPEFSILYQMGDFYETFFDDAVRISKDLNMLLTKRGKVNGENVPLAGFPLRQLNTYVKKLLEIGRKVVIVEQVQDSSEAKGVVDAAPAPIKENIKPEEAAEIKEKLEEAGAVVSVK